MTALIDVAYVEYMWGQSVPSDDDQGRVEFLIEEASALVIEECAPYSSSWSETSCPTRVKQAVARMVISVMVQPTGTDVGVKAEQIGDYRVEWARPGQPMDVSLVEGLLRPYRSRAFSIQTPGAMDGAS